MNKLIEILGYNQVTIKKRYANGDCLCDVQLIETTEATETTEAVEVVVKSDTDIILTYEQLELMDEEIEDLNPTKVMQDETSI